MERFKQTLAAAGVLTAVTLGTGWVAGCGEADDGHGGADNTIEGTAHDEHDGHDHAGHNAAEKLKDAAEESQRKAQDMANDAGDAAE